MQIHRNPAAVVLDGDRIVGVNPHADVVRVTGERFVDRIVDDFVHEMVKTAARRRADVHAGAFTDGFQSLEYLDLACVVTGRGLCGQSLSHDFSWWETRKKRCERWTDLVRKLAPKLYRKRVVYHCLKYR